MNIRQLLDEGHRPFASHPRVDRYFPAAAIEDARSRLTRSIQRGDGPGLVIGSAGTGKSLLLQVLAAQYQDQLDVVLLACAQICTRRALLQAILFELGLPYRQRDEGQLRLTLLDHLLSDQQSPEGLLLLVDEAQALSVALLEELRMMTNLVRRGTPRVRLVLAGSPALEETFAGPELESFSQRLAARCYLGPWGREETTQYVRAQLAASGADPDAVFAPEAWGAIVDATDGVPRLVNQLCDRALLAADAESRPRVDRQTIQKAWADLQQLPTPWDTPAESTPNEPQQVVEFGSLSDPADALFDAGGLATAAEAVADVGADEEPVCAAWSDDDAPIDIAAAMIEPAAEDVSKNDSGDPPLPLGEGRGEGNLRSTALPPNSLPKGEGSFWTGSEDATAARQPSDPGPWAGRRPQVCAETTGDSTNPFDEPFDEEEIVLDSFVAWDAVQAAHLPRVENLRDRQFAARVQDVLDASAASAADVGTAGSSPARGATGPQPEEQPADEAALAVGHAANGEEPSEEADDKWPPLRLAIVSEAAALHPVPLIQSSGPAVLTATAAFDPVMPEEDVLDFQEDEAAQTVFHAAASVAAPSEAAFTHPEYQDASDDPILIVEEEPEEEARAMPPVRREEYRQLFSRLRG